MGEVADVTLRYIQEDGPESGHVRVVLTPEARSLTIMEARMAAEQAFLASVEGAGARRRPEAHHGGRAPDADLAHRSLQTRRTGDRLPAQERARLGSVCRGTSAGKEAVLVGYARVRPCNPRRSATRTPPPPAKTPPTAAATPWHTGVGGHETPARERHARITGGRKLAETALGGAPDR